MLLYWRKKIAGREKYVSHIVSVLFTLCCPSLNCFPGCPIMTLPTGCIGTSPPQFTGEERHDTWKFSVQTHITNRHHPFPSLILQVPRLYVSARERDSLSLSLMCSRSNSLKQSQRLRKYTMSLPHHIYFSCFHSSLKWVESQPNSQTSPTMSFIHLEDRVSQ